MQALTTINPYYAARLSRRANGAASGFSTAKEAKKTDTLYVKLPRAPINSSPVPGLTSLYHNAEAGPYGDRSYPGNCSGNLIKDLILYFGPQSVCDPMTGSGTCRDVCVELGVACDSFDVKSGFDACDERSWQGLPLYDFVWIHPPYWRQKVYSNDPRDMSTEPTLRAFCIRYQKLIANCARALKSGGRLAVLMGDYCDREAGYVPLVHATKHYAFGMGLKQCCTDIIRFSHGASSSRKVYRSSFIPGLHDTCVIFQKS